MLSEMTEARQLYNKLKALFKDYPRVKIKVVQTFGCLIDVEVSNTRSVPASILSDFIAYLQGQDYFEHYYFEVRGLFGNRIHSWKMDEIESAINYSPHLFEKTKWLADGIIRG